VGTKSRKFKETAAMSTPSAQNLLGRLGFSALLLLVATIAMLLAYGGVPLFRGTRDIRREPSALIGSEADQLHRLSNDVVHCMAEYLDQRRHSNAGDIPLDAWIAAEFTPEITALRRRVLAAAIPEPAMAGLLAAVDRLAAMAAQPQRDDLREAATKAVLDAITTAESYLYSGEGPEAVLAPLDVPPLSSLYLTAWRPFAAWM